MKTKRNESEGNSVLIILFREEEEERWQPASDRHQRYTMWSHAAKTAMLRCFGHRRAWMGTTSFCLAQRQGTFMRKQRKCLDYLKVIWMIHLKSWTDLNWISIKCKPVGFMPQQTIDLHQSFLFYLCLFLGCGQVDPSITSCCSLQGLECWRVPVGSWWWARGWWFSCKCWSSTVNR